MELKKLFGSVAMAAIMAACSSNDVEQTSPTPGKITIHTSVTAATRVGLSEQGEATSPGLKAVWQSTDQLVVDYASSDAVSKFTIGTISADGHEAEFSGTLSPTPTQKVTVKAAAMTAAVQQNSHDVVVNLTSQTGQIDDLGKYDVLTGQGEYNPANASSIQMSMKHQVAFIRGTIVLPFTPTAETYALNLKGDNLVAKSTISLRDDSKTDDASTNTISVTAAKVDGNKLTFYVAVLPQTLTNLRADVTGPSGEAYNDLLVTDNFTVEAGKLYTVTRNNETLEDVSLWTNNQAWSKTYNVANYKIASIERVPAEGSDWLTVTSDGSKVVVSATANSTGAPRQAKLVFSNGSQTTTVDVTQIDESDFAGNWNMVAYKAFYTTGTPTMSNYDSKWGAVGTTPGDGRTDMKVVDGVDYKNKTELTLTNTTGKTVTAFDCKNYVSQTATNNISIQGLFENMKVEALSKVDHTAQSATVSILFDTHSSSKAQRLYTGQYAGQYVCMMPELSTGINSGWAFQYATIGGLNYAWYVGTVSVTGHTTTVRWDANTSSMQKLKTSTSAPKLYVCGLQIMRYYSPTISSTYMVRQKAGGYSASNFGAYAVTYQGDIVVKRTASGYKDIEIGGGNN